MKNHFCKFVFAFLFLLFSKGAFAQSRIMDGKIDWVLSNGQYAGQLSVFLTDTIELSGLKISLGVTTEDSSLYLATFTTGAGGNFSGTLIDNVLQTSIGTFSSHPDYYATISILLSNGKKNQISIHSSN